MPIYNAQELAGLGLGAYGADVRLSRKASLHNAKNIRLGDHVRIDDFCVLSAGEGGIDIHNFVHIAVFSSLIGAGKMTLHDFSNLSSRVCVYSSSDDYSGVHMTNPMIPPQFTAVAHAPVSIGKHVIVGAGSVLLPGVVLEEGVAVGALSVVKENCQAFGIYAGCPARRIGNRRRDLLQLELEFLRQLDGTGAPQIETITLTRI
jgi:dTDP-4-amino-4,6-dideoxy-D-glucose acyltransferase